MPGGWLTICGSFQGPYCVAPPGLWNLMTSEPTLASPPAGQAALAGDLDSRIGLSHAAPPAPDSFTSEPHVSPAAHMVFAVRVALLSLYPERYRRHSTRHCSA